MGPGSSPLRLVSGAVLAGGRSRRLGRDKRVLEVDGVPLLVRTVQALAPHVDDVTVVIAHGEDPTSIMALFEGRVRVVADARAGHGPAAGLEAALASARHQHALVVAGDHPDLQATVLQLLVDTATGTVKSEVAAPASDASTHRAVALEGAYGPEPLLAIYRSDALPLVRAALDDGVRRLQDVLGRLEPWCIPATTWRVLDPAGLTLSDLDTPDDVATREQRRA